MLVCLFCFFGLKVNMDSSLDSYLFIRMFFFVQLLDFFFCIQLYFSQINLSMPFGNL
uniref:Uncharacterized protein n=1 Tax=Rhizophora mucronata TaxID=61149 RepID=A0A2P2MJL2_RHIMU